MAETLSYYGTLVVVSCWCGMRHAVPTELRNFQDRAHQNGQKQEPIYCPLGHMHVISGESEVDQLRRRLSAERDRAATDRAARDQAEASARAYKGVATRARKRAQAGVCPCCKRTFQNVKRHVASQHPEFDPEVI